MDGLEKIVKEGFDDLGEKIDDAFKDHETRLRTVEKTQSEQAGGWKVLSIIGGAAGVVGGIIAGLWSTLFGGG